MKPIHQYPPSHVNFVLYGMHCLKVDPHIHTYSTCVHTQHTIHMYVHTRTYTHTTKTHNVYQHSIYTHTCHTTTYTYATHTNFRCCHITTKKQQWKWSHHSTVVDKNLAYTTLITGSIQYTYMHIIVQYIPENS